MCFPFILCHLYTNCTTTGRIIGIYLIIYGFIRSCDADPATFAKYVLALIRKEKSEPELRHICLSELEAFLNTSELLRILI